MKNLLELHADASDEVSLLDDSEVVQYVVGDVRNDSRAGLCYCLGAFWRVTGRVLRPACALAAMSLSAPFGCGIGGCRRALSVPFTRAR